VIVQGASLQTLLPALREELSLHPGPTGIDGAPTWTLQDPVRNRFFRIDWPTFQILSQWHLRHADAICDAVAAETTLRPDTADVDAVLQFLAQGELLQPGDARATKRLLDATQRRRGSALSWLLHHYLFFRIPLWKPDAWLGRIAPRLDWLYSRGFALLTAAAALLGLLQTSRQWPQFTATFVDTLSWDGLVSYGCVIIGIKFVHELGHAITAKRQGCRVPTIGIAFLVLWPVAYTDVNEAWKLPRRQQRLAVSAAGILTELIVAAWATLAWNFLPDGPLRSACFLLAAVTWISTVVLNASPFMRFDGYFLLSDALDLPNLHTRAFALARWQLRETLFKLGEARPEHFPKRLERFLIAFAWATAAYRLVLFIGIALLVYHHAFKALGIVLFVVEIAWFIVMPVLLECREWWQRRDAILRSVRTRYSLFFTAALLALALLPLDRHVAAQAVLQPTRAQALYVPGAARVERAPLAHGTVVTAGDTIAVLAPEVLEFRLQHAEARLTGVEADLAAAALNPASQGDLPVLRQQRETLLSELDAIADEASRYQLTAAFTGTVVDTAPDLHDGDSVPANARLATLVDPSKWQARSYLPEADIARIRAGASARFYPDSPGQAPIALQVTGIDRDATHRLDQPMLASIHGGEIPVHLRGDTAIPDQALYAVTLSAADGVMPATLRTQRGRVIVDGNGQSVAGRYLRNALAVLIRESGW